SGINAHIRQKDRQVGSKRLSSTPIFIYGLSEKLCTLCHFESEIRYVAIDDLELRSASDWAGWRISSPVRSRWNARRSKRTVRRQRHADCPVIWSCPDKWEW